MAADQTPAVPRVGVTGLGIVSAIGRNVPAFNGALRSGRHGIQRLPEDWLKGNTGAGAVLDDFSIAGFMDQHDIPARYRHAARCAARMPANVQASLAAALEAWLAAGLSDGAPVPERTGIVAGGSNLSPQLAFELHEKLQTAPALFSPRYAYMHLDSIHLGVVSEVLGIRGESCTVGGASASGNLAIIKGHQAIRANDLDICVVIGAMTCLSPMELQAFFNIGALAALDDGGPGQVCRPFDQDRRGFVPGQAAACLILESPESAARRGVPILAEIPGTACLLDGNHLPNPSARGEAKVMAEALRRAGLAPGQIDYLNAHGTGSLLGDATEAEAICEVFQDHASRLWINSTKSLTGHCLSSAGAVEAIATIVQMREGFVHPNLNLEKPIAGCRFCGPAAAPCRIDAALSNSFGFGGINTCVAFVKGSEG